MRATRVARMVLIAFAALVFAFLYGPIVAVVILSFGNSVSVLSMSNMTTRWYVSAANNPQVFAAFWFSLKLGLASTACAVTIGTMAALVLVRQRLPAKGMVKAALFAPMVVPEIIIAISLLVVLSMFGVPRGLPSLVIGHTMLLLPYVITIISSRLYGFDWSLHEAALNLGARPWRVFFEVVLPLLAPAVIGASVVAFKVSFNEVVGGIFWSSLRERTLPVVVLGMLNGEFTPEVNAIGTVMIAITLTLIATQQLVEYWRNAGERRTM